MSDYLPPELLINVVKRLPVKTLLRFRCVCKEWCSLITNPDFISQHLDRLLLTPRTLVRYCTLYPNGDPFTLIKHYLVRFDNNVAFDEYAKPEFPFTTLAFFFGIVGSCNGLLCLFDGFLGRNLHNLYLWNPLIGKSVIVPVPGVSFTTEQRPYFYTFGFGFDEFRNDYKVVAIMSLEVDESSEVLRFTLSTPVVGEISHKALRCSLPFGAPHAYLNGVVHWVASNYGKPMNDTERSYIVTFRIEDEVLGEMMLPETRSMMLEIMRRVGCLTVLQDSLSYIDSDIDGDVSSCWVWVMKKYGVENSWTLLFRVDTSSELVWPVGFRINGELVMQATNVSLISYDPESKWVKDLGIHECDLQEQCYDTFYLGKYMESLVLLDRGRSLLRIGTTDGSLLM